MKSPSVLIIALLSPASALPADTTISSTGKFAWSANAGWINFRPDQPASPAGIIVGEYFLGGLAHSANTGWLNCGGSTPANGIRYQNTSGADFGVNHDGAGNLSGLAWAANTGWVNFGWAAANDSNRPRVSLVTGEFSGYAWSANTGWINLGTGLLTTTAVRITDTDGDGMADAWERTSFGNLTAATATSDADGDGASDLDEYRAGTAPGSAADYFRIVSASYNGSYTMATVVFTTSATRHYRLETSEDLTTWTNSPHGTFAPDAGVTTTHTLSWAGAARKFIRAVPVRPLAE